jgi:hypothetical protein
VGTPGICSTLSITEGVEDGDAPGVESVATGGQERFNTPPPTAGGSGEAWGGLDASQVELGEVCGLVLTGFSIIPGAGGACGYVGAGYGAAEDKGAGASSGTGAGAVSSSGSGASVATAAFCAMGHEGPGSGADGVSVGDVMVVPQWGHGPVTPASSLGTVRSMPQDWQLKWMTFGTELMI